MDETQGKGSQGQQGGQKGTPGTQAGSMGSRHGSTGTPQGSQQMQGSQGAQQFTDPVCGMNVQKGKFGGTSTYQGQTYHFCSEGCKEKFDRSPQQFARKTA